MVEQYIKVYEWLLKHEELNRLEALLVSEVMRWPKGCYKSSAQLAELLNSDPRTIQRKILSLQKRGWLAVLHPKKQHRIIWATPKEPPAGPLFEYQQKSTQAIQNKRQKQVAAMTAGLGQKLAGD